MLTLSRLVMPKGAKAGQDGGEKVEKGTHQIRVNADLGEMIAWILRIEGGTSAVLLDPMLRAQVTARYKRYEKEIDELRAAEDAMKAVEAGVKEKLKEKLKKKE